MQPASRDDNEVNRPNVARIYDAALGGFANFVADRAALDALLDAYPDTLLAARANRAFLRRAVAFLAAQGIDRFLDVGSGLPTVGNVHEVARRVNPKARVVYVDNDPVAVRYSRELLEEEAVSGVAAIEADLRDPAAILSRPAVRRLLAARRPLALLLLAVLPLIPDDDAARRVVRQLTAALPTGSYLAISHATLEGGEAQALAQFVRQYEARTSPVAFRPRATIEDFFAGCELVPPGLVFLPAWRPDGAHDPLRDEPERAASVGAVGRKRWGHPHRITRDTGGGSSARRRERSAGSAQFGDPLRADPWQGQQLRVAASARVADGGQAGAQ